MNKDLSEFLERSRVMLSTKQEIPSGESSCRNPRDSCEIIISKNPGKLKGLCRHPHYISDVCNFAIEGMQEGCNYFNTKIYELCFIKSL